MEPEAKVIARAAAARLAAQDNNPRLLYEVLQHCDGGSAPAGAQQYEPLSFSIATLVVAAASLAWMVYRDSKADREPPVIEAVSRRVRIEMAERYPDVAANDRSLVIDVVIEELRRTN